MLTNHLEHLTVFPIAIPMFAGALILLLKEKRKKLNTAISFVAVIFQLLVALKILFVTLPTEAGKADSATILTYFLGNWEAPFGIVLVADQLAAIMLCLTAILGFCALTYSNSFWNRIGVHFYPLFQFILMGLNGAFLTGDLFNLFVFFEIFLAASYGLLLHGSGENRVTSSMHYITVNLIGALLLLISISMIYGITGTLNLAELSIKAGLLNQDDRILFETACSILGIAFLIKAAAWPLNFWLPNAYTVAAAPIATLFAVMTKVGIYALLRVGSLLIPSGAPAAFGGEWMYYIGLATILFGTFAMFTEKNIGRLVGFSIILSSGTLLTALGMPGVVLTGPSLYYMVSSVMATGCFFLLVELISRTESVEKTFLNVSMEAFGLDEGEKDSDYSGNVVGVPVPAAMAFLGLSFFVCSLILAGLPPLSGFIGKVAILSIAMDIGNQSTPQFPAWLMIILLLTAGLATVVAFSRAGIRLFWVPDNLKTPVLTIREALPIIILVFACILMSVFANPLMEMMHQAALQLDDPTQYSHAVFKQQTIN